MIRPTHPPLPIRVVLSPEHLFCPDIVNLVELHPPLCGARHRRHG
jgi:hypothetical protein